MQLSQILSEIDNEIERLQQARTLLTGALVVSPKRREIPTPTAGRKEENWEA